MRLMGIAMLLLQGIVRAAQPGGDFITVAPPAKIEVLRAESFAAEWDKVAFSHEIFNSILQRHINKQGEVDYAALMADAKTLDEYIYRLQNTPAEGLVNDAARYAYWVNAYNAFTMKAVLAMLPKEKEQWARFSLSATEPSVWKTTRFIAGGKELTLDDIEHSILRVQFKDARVHAAVNCGSKSCPRLQPFAFTADKLDAQLDLAASAWVNDLTKNQKAGDQLEVSKIFQWYSKDFNGGAEQFIAKYTTDKELKAKLESGTGMKIKYMDYNWGLNQAAPPPAEKK